MLFDRPQRRDRRVGLTPLIDVVFLLLIFFMLASQLGQARVLTLQVSEPGAASQAAGDTASTLRLSAAGEILVGEHRVPLGAPTATLRAALTASISPGERTAPVASQDQLILVADDLANVQQITRALVDLELAGASSVTLAGER